MPAGTKVCGSCFQESKRPPKTEPTRNTPTGRTEAKQAQQEHQRLLDILTERGTFRPETWIAAAKSLASAGAAVVPQLVALVNAENVYARRLVVAILADIGDPGTTNTLLALAQNERCDLDVRKAAVYGLGNIGRSDTIDFLVKLGETPSDWSSLRRAAYLALGCIPSPEAEAAIKKAASSGDGYVQNAARKAASLGGKGRVNVLSQIGSIIDIP